MQTINLLRENAKKALDKGNALIAEMQGDPAKQTDAKLAEVKAAQDEFDRLDALYKAAVQIESKGRDYVEGGGIFGASFGGFSPAGEKAGDVETDTKGWREVEIDTHYGKQAIRYFVPLSVEKAGKAHKSAFEAFARRGAAALGPNDRKALNETTDADGGYLVTEQMQREIIKKVATLVYMRQLARVVTTSTNNVVWPKIDYTSDNKFTSPARMTWTGETPASSTAHRITQPTFGELGIPIHTAMASLPISMNLIEDSAFDVIGVATEMLAEAFSLGENDAFVNGNGTSKPSGLLLNAGTTGIPVTVSGTSAALTTSGDAHEGKRLVDAYYATPSQYRGREAAWLMNSATLNAIDNMVDAQKRPLVRELTTASLGSAEPNSLKGKAIYTDEFMPDVAANSVPVVFGHFRGYAIVDRVGIGIRRLEENYAEVNMALLLARKRVGGALIEPWRLRGLKCSA